MRRAERHHLKENELAQTIARAGDVIATRRREIIGGIVAVLVLVAAVAGYLVWRGRTEARAGALLADALAVNEAPIAPPAAPAQPGAPTPAPPPGSYPTEHARLDAALPKFLAVANAYPSTAAGVAGRYHAANSLAALGRVQEAQTRYQEVIDRDGAGIYGQMARLGLADLQVASGRYDHAITIYKELTADRDSRLPVDGVLMQLGRAYARAGKSSDARQTFQRIVDEFPESLYLSSAKQELARLNRV